ncbi:MAG: amidohydrolase family protein, partial [Ferruginibacter sp.]
MEEIKAIQQETVYTIDLQRLLQWATINGARALQVDNVFGSFEKGKRPGIVLIEGLRDFQCVPESFARRIF